jgi:hypothetical protein
MKRAVLGIVGMLVLLVLAWSYGLWVGVKKKPPFQTIKRIHHYADVAFGGLARWDDLEQWSHLNVPDLIRISSPEDIMSKRKELIA